MANTDMNLSLTLTVVNEGNEAERKALEIDIQDIGAKLEDGEEVTEADAFLLAAFQNDYVGMNTDERIAFFVGTVVDFSTYFPGLVFALEGRDYDPYDVEAVNDPEALIWRRYVSDGRVQYVEPQIVVPDFDAEQLQDP